MTKKEQQDIKKMKDEKKSKISKLQRKRIVRKFGSLLKITEDLKTLEFNDEL